MIEETIKSIFMHSHDILKVSCHTHMKKVIIRMVIMMIGAKQETNSVYVSIIAHWIIKQ